MRVQPKSHSGKDECKYHHHLRLIMAACGCKHKKRACKKCNSGICSVCCTCLKRMGRPRKNEDEQRPQRVMAMHHTKTPARFLNGTLSDSEMMLLDPVPTLRTLSSGMDHPIKLDLLSL